MRGLLYKLMKGHFCDDDDDDDMVALTQMCHIFVFQFCGLEPLGTHCFQTPITPDFNIVNFFIHFLDQLFKSLPVSVQNGKMVMPLGTPHP